MDITFNKGGYNGNPIKVTYTKQATWIPVKDGYPPEDVMVMATLLDGPEEPPEDKTYNKKLLGEYYDRYISYEMWFKGDHWYDTSLDDRIVLKEVLAWRPLPEVFKG